MTVSDYKNEITGVCESLAATQCRIHADGTAKTMGINDHREATRGDCRFLQGWECRQTDGTAKVMDAETKNPTTGACES